MNAYQIISLIGFVLLSSPVHKCLAQDPDSLLTSTSDAQLTPLLKKYCHDCHNTSNLGSAPKHLNFSRWDEIANNPETIEMVYDAVRRGEMPPSDAPRPTDPEHETIVRALKQLLKSSLSDKSTLTPFRLRRMNRFESGNAVRDLFKLRSWVYSINDRIIRDHNHYFRPETGKMPDRVVVGNRLMGLQQLLENRLLGVMAFPKDAPAENGFNNRGDHLSLSPVLMQSFLELSQSVLNAENFDENCGVWNELFADPANPEPKSKVVEINDPEGMQRGPGLTLSAWIRTDHTPDSWQTIARREDGWRRQLLAIGRTGDTWGLWMGAGVNNEYLEFGAEADRELLGDGEWHHVAGTLDEHNINLHLDGKLIGSQPIDGKLDTQSNRPMEIGSYNGRELFHGDIKDFRLFRIGLTEDQIGSLANANPNIATKFLVGTWKTPDPRALKLERPILEIAHDRIERFLVRAFRTATEDKTLRLYKNYFDKRFGETQNFTQSMKDVVSAALASPRFMMVHNESNQKMENQGSYNLATRLSFFLWSSIPDDELLSLADAGALDNEDALRTQVERMLNHSRSKNFCDSFAPQWLKLNSLVSASPDFQKYREYYFGGDDKISYKRGMHMMLEPLLNFETIFVENRSILELIDSNFTYRSHLLSEWYEGRAATYPINVNLRDIEYRRVPLEDRRHGGVLTTSAVMVMTSSPLRSLPITRGSWVASVIFNNPPKPPPDNTPALNADDKTLKEEGQTVRQKLKQHSSDQQCVGCHQKIDPFGFALENYDLLGRWRDEYRTGLPVDASGIIFGNVAFQDVVELKEAIVREQKTFATAFVQHLLSYALGRELTLTDRLAAAEIAEATQKDEYRMRHLIQNLVLHPIFSQRGGR